MAHIVQPQGHGFNSETSPGLHKEDSETSKALHPTPVNLHELKPSTILGGSWDLVTTFNCAYNLTYNPPKWAYRGYPNYR